MSTSTQWQLSLDAAERYERILVPPILGPFARALVEWSNPQPGEVVLDVGCGTGAAARFAVGYVGPSGRVLGVDLNPGMLAVAKSVSDAPIEWHEKSAFDLPLSDQTVDLALCAQTLQFIQDRPRALAEMRRVLRPGGRVNLSLWSDIQESPYFHALTEAVSRHIGKDTAAGLGSAFTLTRPDEILSLLRGAGFGAEEITVARLALELPPLEEFIPRHISATPMVSGYNAAPRATQQALIDDIIKEMARFQGEDGLRVPFSSYMARGTKEDTNPLSAV